MKKLAIVLALCSTAALAADSGKSVKVEGYISDSKCGAMHGAKGADPACVSKCIGGGAKPVFVGDAKGEVWTIDNPEAVKGHYGHHVILTATEDSDKMTVHVDKLAMAKSQPAAKADDSMEHMAH